MHFVYMLMYYTFYDGIFYSFCVCADVSMFLCVNTFFVLTNEGKHSTLKKMISSRYLKTNKYLFSRYQRGYG